MSTSRLPVSSQQVNSSTKIPTSSLVYSMNQTLLNILDNIEFKYYMTFPAFTISYSTYGTRSHTETVPSQYRPVKRIEVGKITFTHSNSGSGVSGNFSIVPVDEVFSGREFSTTGHGQYLKISYNNGDIKVSSSAATSSGNSCQISAFDIVVYY